MGAIRSLIGEASHDTAPKETTESSSVQEDHDEDQITFFWSQDAL